MRYLIYLFFLSIALSAHAQALRDINYRYLYNPEEPFSVSIKAARGPQNWTVLYELEIRDTTLRTSDFVIQWDLRNALNEKEGSVIQSDSITKQAVSNTILRGRLSVTVAPTPQILVAKVLNNQLKRAWFFYQELQPKSPVTGYLFYGDEQPVLSPYVKKDASITIHGFGTNNSVSYYNDDFPPATPAFSEALGRVSKGMKVDSAFTFSATEPVSFENTGLYLIQRDTSTAEGVAFRVEDDYPKYAKVENLADPLIYICTRQEFQRIKAAKGDKRAFDRVILSVTGNAERARIFMRSYFRRVELANYYFTSYKEGWKTDRGMVYIIFGLPDEVFKLNDREIWAYKNNYKLNFEFTKSSTVFDAENYVLLRQKKFEQTWYEVIDLWRNARF